MTGKDCCGMLGCHFCGFAKELHDGYTSLEDVIDVVFASGDNNYLF